MIDWEYERTEEAAIEREEQENGWHRCYDKDEIDIYEEVDRIIKNTDGKRLKKLIESPEVYFKFKSRAEFKIIMFIMIIYDREAAAGIKEHILTKGDSREEIFERVINETRFYLWRIELAKDDSMLEKLIAYVLENTISPYALSYITVTSAVDRKIMYLRLISEFLQRDDLKYAFILVSDCLEIYPGDEEIKALYAQFIGTFK